MVAISELNVYLDDKMQQTQCASSSVVIPKTAIFLQSPKSSTNDWREKKASLGKQVQDTVNLINHC